MTNIELKAEIARLQAENASLASKAKAAERSLSLKVSAKGGISVYGLGQYPTTLYAGQWERLLPFVPEIKAFMLAHHAELSVKPSRDAETTAPVTVPVQS